MAGRNNLYDQYLYNLFLIHLAKCIIIILVFCKGKSYDSDSDSDSDSENNCLKTKNIETKYLVMKLNKAPYSAL